MLIRYELEDTQGGMLVAIHATRTPGRFFGWASPIMARQVRRSITADLQKLRTCLET
jgi:hypothetical protein